MKETKAILALAGTEATLSSELASSSSKNVAFYSGTACKIEGGIHYPVRVYQPFISTALLALGSLVWGSQ